MLLTACLALCCRANSQTAAVMITKQKCQTSERKCRLTNTHRQFEHVIRDCSLQNCIQCSVYPAVGFEARVMYVRRRGGVVLQ